jgi:hypothetical protein
MASALTSRQVSCFHAAGVQDLTFGILLSILPISSGYGRYKKLLWPGAASLSLGSLKSILRLQSLQSSS